MGRRSVPCAWDWDADGDLDLLVGENSGTVLLFLLEKETPAGGFGRPSTLTTTGGALSVGHYAAPTVADWDLDGREDLLVGGSRGEVLLFRNTGKKGAPRFAPGLVLVEPNSSRRLEHGGTPARPGGRAFVSVADWNADGRPDLLVGDCTFEEGRLPDPPPITKEEQDAAYRRYREHLQRYRRLSKVPAGEKEAERKIRLASRDEARKAYREQYAIYRKGVPRTIIHGWVWLYLRKPPPTPDRDGADIPE